jgi:hypothetical protein
VSNELGDDYVCLSQAERERRFAEVSRIHMESELPEQFCMRGDGRVVRREPKHVIEPDIFEPTSEVRAAIELARLNGRVRELEWIKESHEGSLERMSEDRDHFSEKCARLEERVRELGELKPDAVHRMEHIARLEASNAELSERLGSVMLEKDRYYRKWRVAAEHINSQPVGGGSDATNPEHYKQGGVECIDAIEAALGKAGFKGYCQGNAIKYLWRHQHKGKAVEDLKKAEWYSARLREELGHD